MSANGLKRTKTHAIEDFFGNSNELISLFDAIQNEMLDCNPDLIIDSRNGLIGLAKEDEKYSVYISPSEEGYEIKP